MTQFNIFRPLDKSEKQDMISIGETDILDLFLKAVAEKKAEYQKQYRPYDVYSARIDFDTKLSKKIDELRSIVDKSKLNPAIDFGDLDMYGDPERFEFVTIYPAMETKLVHGTKTEVHIGNRYSFKGKMRGNRITIFVPTEDDAIMQTFLKKHFKVEEDKKEKKEVEKDED